MSHDTCTWIERTRVLALPRAVNVTIYDDILPVDLEHGRTIPIPIGWYPRLAHGTSAERANFQISGAGLWYPLARFVRGDIGVEGLLPGKKSIESLASL
jgi:hypothetical protein